MSFKDKVVNVTGSSSGIGAATAIEFAKEGANVVITGRNEDKLNNVYKECSKYGKTPLVVKADISDEAQSKSIIENTIENFGKIDVLVNNAGHFVLGSILDGNLMKAYDGVMSTNLRPVFYLTMLAAPHLIKTKGNIVNVSSVGGSIISGTLFIPYCASKAALDHCTQGSALELGPFGVRVNTVNPGLVRTDISPVEWDSIGKKLTLLQKVAEPKEVADMIVCLASDKAKSITGALHCIDNGFRLHVFAR